MKGLGIGDWELGMRPQGTGDFSLLDSPLGKR